ncbi:hypothetical protein [Bacillus thuringiensis]|uniref:hypothetical protein n=1 Tax=Bacillus thuringiensis TaxID=1428 RepID=UPI0020D273D5|nr:hypothetical protein [Bacillus thuringiensis]
MDNQYIEKKINNWVITIDSLIKNVSDLQRDNDGLKQALLNVSTNVEALNRKINMLEEALATRADHVREIAKEFVGIKKIENSKSVGMDCKVGISLSGKVVADSIQGRVRK